MTRKEVEILFKQHYAQMYHLAFSLLMDQAQSQDVVSDVFVGLLSSKTDMRADTAGAFLLASVRNRSINVLKHKQVRERFARLLTLDTDTLASDNTAEDQLQVQALMRYVQHNLSPLEQEIFKLRYVQEMTCQEVAQAQGISRQTVHNHLKQCVEKIRKYFAARNTAAARQR